MSIKKSNHQKNIELKIGSKNYNLFFIIALNAKNFKNKLLISDY